MNFTQGRKKVHTMYSVPEWVAQGYTPFSQKLHKRSSATGHVDVSHSLAISFTSISPAHGARLAASAGS
jgi:hypothetical protein